MLILSLCKSHGRVVVVHIEWRGDGLEAEHVDEIGLRDLALDLHEGAVATQRGIENEEELINNR